MEIIMQYRKIWNGFLWIGKGFGVSSVFVFNNKNSSLPHPS